MGISDDDIFTLENYVIKNGIRGNKCLRKVLNIQFHINFSDLLKIRSFLETVNEIKKKSNLSYF